MCPDQNDSCPGSPQNDRSKSGIVRSAAMGAALLAVVTAPGTCFYLYQWAATGNVLRLGEATVLLFVASFVGGLGGAAYHMVLRSRLTSPWKPFVAVVAAMEAYLLGFSFVALVTDLVAPQPLSEGWFWLSLHGYGVLLCVVAWGFAYVLRFVQILVAVVALVLMLLFSVMMLMLQAIKPEHLDLWFSFLKPLSVAFQLLLVVLIPVSVVGWVQFLRGSRDAQ